MVSVIAAAIAGLGAIAALMAVFANWDAVKAWFRDFVTALKGLFTSTLKGIAHAAGAFVKVLKEGMAATMHKLYYKDNGQYVEEIRTRVVPEKALPPWAKAKLKESHGMEAEMTEPLQQELKMTL